MALQAVDELALPFGVQDTVGTGGGATAGDIRGTSSCSTTVWSGAAIP
jgi:hypothetical protein